jgi:hypothetical protein
MRVLVTGSRDWPDHLVVYRALLQVCEENDLFYPPDEHGNTMPDPNKITVIHGHCPTGADAIADDWCIANFFMAERHPADWSKGRSAGPRRNKEMVNLGADICLAFIKNNSRGASMTARLAEGAGIETRRFTA